MRVDLAGWLKQSFAGTLLLIHAACASVPLSQETRASEEAAILSLLEEQDLAWNAGDIEGFMAGYWKSPELRFASGGNITRGWDETLARYQARYGASDEMGTLTTSDHDIQILSPDAAIAHGKWQLDWKGRKPWGLYTLVLRKVDGDWFIVSDTTTSAD